MNVPTYLGLDLGTSSLKALLVDERQTPLGVETVPLTISFPHKGWSEQAPDSWIDAARTAFARLARSMPDAMARLSGIGLSGQMHGACALGPDDRPLRPAILWNDTRAAEEARELDDGEARAITGNIVFPGFTAPKLLWMARNEPGLFEATRRVLLPKDYLRLWLTGRAVSDMSDAAGTAWFDTGARRWSDRMLERTGLGRAAMPDLVEGSEASGTLRDSLAEEFGLPRGIVVAGGGGDNAASACGVGVVRPGTGLLSLGTSGVLFIPTASYRPAPETALHAFCHALPGLWHHMGVTLSAAGSLEWLSRILGRSPGEVAGLAGGRVGAPGSIRFLPYLSGERTPHNDPDVRGAFTGLDVSSDTGDLVRGLMQGVAFSVRDCSEASRSLGADLPAILTVVGAGTRSDYWLGVMATVLDTPLMRPEGGDAGAALGAARLAMLAAGAGDPASILTAGSDGRIFEPAPDLVPAYDEAYVEFRSLYRGLSAERAVPGATNSSQSVRRAGA